MESMKQQTTQTTERRPQTSYKSGHQRSPRNAPQKLITQEFHGLPQEVAGIAIGRKGSIWKLLTSGRLGFRLKSYKVINDGGPVSIVIVGTPFDILRAEKWLFQNIEQWVAKAFSNTQTRCMWGFNPQNKAFYLQLHIAPPVCAIPVAQIPVIQEQQQIPQSPTYSPNKLHRPSSPTYPPPSKQDSPQPSKEEVAEPKSIQDMLEETDWSK